MYNGRFVHTFPDVHIVESLGTSDHWLKRVISRTMIVSPAAVESLNSQLNLLSKGGYEGLQLDEFQHSELSEQYLSVCNALINELLQPDMQVTYSSVEEVRNPLYVLLLFDESVDD